MRNCSAKQPSPVRTKRNDVENVLFPTIPILAKHHVGEAQKTQQLWNPEQTFVIEFDLVRICLQTCHIYIMQCLYYYCVFECGCVDRCVWCSGSLRRNSQSISLRSKQIPINCLALSWCCIQSVCFVTILLLVLLLGALIRLFRPFFAFSFIPWLFLFWCIYYICCVVGFEVCAVKWPQKKNPLESEAFPRLLLNKFRMTLPLSTCFSTEVNLWSIFKFISIFFFSLLGKFAENQHAFYLHLV